MLFHHSGGRFTESPLQPTWFQELHHLLSITEKVQVDVMIFGRPNRPYEASLNCGEDILVVSKQTGLAAGWRLGGVWVLFHHSGGRFTESPLQPTWFQELHHLLSITEKVQVDVMIFGRPNRPYEASLNCGEDILVVSGRTGQRDFEAIALPVYQNCSQPTII